ncbi:hypothetical protein DMR_01400 [Solidesulfovibrio magneticus RS-1]|uniref:Uncharacterized protein n=1 Tax=Solidesulfovibrio magneticus (strain ATCC 700980 / DSM 13731 / RS-1) TaxID=573370 RepID=C4XTW6_SOLM1|nr:hypothetical protein DMR_01400 [Solidesulfovibrio magneticus RS-1]
MLRSVKADLLLALAFFLWEYSIVREILDCVAEVGLSLCVSMHHLPARRTQYET